jgi:ketosteroid isomerase-like protein
MSASVSATSKNVQAVKSAYESFGRGDAQALLGGMADEVEFRLAEGHPYQPSGEAWRGKQELLEKFLMKAGPEWESWTVQVDEIHPLGDTVVVEGRYYGLFKPTGRRMDLQVCHVWQLRDGVIRSFHQYLDTGALQRIMTLHDA